MTAIRSKKEQFDAEFSEIYSLYADSIFRFCLSKLNCSEENAKDCVQDTFLVFYKRLKSGETFENPRAFLYRTANNFVKKKHAEILKTLGNRALADEKREAVAENSSTVEINVDFKFFEAKLNELLSDEEKAIYTMRFVEEKSIDAIADKLGINKKYCTVKISRLRQKIRAELSDFRL